MNSIVTESQIYWLTRMDYICGLGWAIGISFLVVLGIILVVLLASRRDEFDEEEKKRYNKWIFLSAFGILPSLLIIMGAALTPSTKEMAAIKLIPMIVNDEKVQELPNKVVGLANEWLDELSPKKIEETEMKGN